MRPSALAERVRGRFADVLEVRDEVMILVDRSELLDALSWLRAEPDLSFGFLSFVTATDRPEGDPRFSVVYQLRSLEHHHVLRVKVGVPQDDPHVPSVVPLYPTADWHERETYDFFGVVFDGHPDLRRILLPEDWDGYPLRKTEELGGVNTRYVGAFIPPVDRRTM